MERIAAIDADGHITETAEQLRPYMQGRGEHGPWPGRRAYYPEDGWDRSLGGKLGTRASTAQEWLDAMDRGGLEMVILYPTAGLGIGWVREPDWAVALCRAYNDFVAEEFLKVSPRLQAVCLIPLQEPEEAVKELRRAITELRFCGVMLPANGLRLPLGHPIYHPIYAEAERLDCFVAIHATVRGPHSFGADIFDRFIEVHTLSHPVAQMIQLTGWVFEGVPEKFPRLRVGFMESGCSWVPYWANRMDEEYEKRAPEAPLLRKKPSEYIRGGNFFFHGEPDEVLLPQALRWLGQGSIFYASDYPHWDHSYPHNIDEFHEMETLTPEEKRAILRENALRMYGLLARV
ncbi:MAG TPA: amidohydrolase family protein [Chloroflexota bacterium]|nr:amidohydrolase family protein [Chloroflexota bacterium]HZU04838.1 amidohydrolase family protein [Chloroflexota bacterium]